MCIRDRTVSEGHKAKEKAYLDENYDVLPGKQKDYDRVVRQNREEDKRIDGLLGWSILGFIFLVGLLVNLSGY